MMRALGTDDSVTACDCCGKVNLKFTVIVELDTGDIAHYGQVCARRNTGKDQRTLTAEMKAHKEAQLAAARAEWHAHPARRAMLARFDERPRGLYGRVAAEFVREAVEAADTVRSAIAQRYGVSRYALM